MSLFSACTVSYVHPPDAMSSVDRFDTLINFELKVREEERRRIAMELHDELGQQMGALRLELSMLCLQNNDGVSDLEVPVERLIGMTDKAIHSIRTIAHTMHNAALSKGIYPALVQLKDEFIRATSTECRLSLPCEELAIEDASATAIFRIAQEALTNAARYSEAKCVKVSLKELDETYLLLEISDDGKGFDFMTTNSQSLGLAGIRQRSLELGGWAEIFSQPGLGTIIQSFLPRRTSS